MYVMSASQTVFGAVAANACFSRFGAIGRSWRLSVVQGLNRRPARPRMPWWRIRRATRPRLTIRPSARSAPCIVAAGRDLKHAAHEPDRPRAGVIADEREPHLGTSAKMPMAFFRTSRSMRVRSRSRFSRAISAAWSAGDGSCGAPAATARERAAPVWMAARQFRSIDGEMPTSVATCIKGRPLLSSSATASRLNSGANSRLVLVIQTPFLLNRAYQRCPPMRGTISLEPVAAFDPVVLPFEGHVRLVEGDEPRVGDGDPVSVAREVGENGPGSGEGSLGVDDPLGPARSREDGVEGALVGEQSEI